MSSQAQIKSRSFSGQILRPTPEVFLQEDGSFGVVVTPWGNRQAAKRTIEILTDYVLSSRQDLEATSPFQKLTCLSPLANTLRVGIMLVNDSLYREENKAEHVVGVELLAFSRSENELAYAQVGAPNLFLARPGQAWTPLSVQVDSATEFSKGGVPLAPLPANLLGLNSTSNMNVSSCRLQQGDRLVLLSHSQIWPVAGSIHYNETEEQIISTKLAKAYPNLPFWLGLVNF